MSVRNSDQELEDVDFINGAVDEDVFTRVEVWNENTDDGDPAIVIACGDMHQVHDRLQHCWKKVTRKAQLLLVNGGAVRLDGASCTNRKLNFVPYLVYQIDEVIPIKEKQLGEPIRRIILYVDYKCGVTGAHGVSIKRACRSAVNAKGFLKEAFPNRQVALKFYLDNAAEILGPKHPLILEHPDARALTFYFSSEAMLDYIERFQKERSATVVH